MGKLSLIEVNTQALAVSKEIKILENISWPSRIENEILPKLAKVMKPIISFRYQKKCYREYKRVLQNLLENLSSEDPLHIYTANTINSYINAIDMIHSVGTARFQELSISEYGHPKHRLFGSEFSHLENAKKILKDSNEYEHSYLSDYSASYTSKDLKKFLLSESKKIFGSNCPKFVISSKMIAKASAGKLKVSIRKDAIFNKYDFQQLLVHELLTHTLTGINGHLQPILKLMGQASPRTTKTQEGLATFAEVITGNMDLERLKRLALRVIALEIALEGADFYDLYQFFVNNGQNSRESFLSTSRILRGGFAKGGIVFTKDGTYLEGLIRIHSLFRWAFKTKNLDLTHLLFCGKIDINDIFILNQAYRQNQISAPKYLPYWYKDLDLLAGKMAFSILLNGINLTEVEKHYSNKLIFDIAA